MFLAGREEVSCKYRKDAMQALNFILAAQMYILAVQMRILALQMFI